MSCLHDEVWRPSWRKYQYSLLSWGIRRSVPRVSRPVVQSLVKSLVLNRLDYGNATLAGIPQHLLRWLQSVMNAAARLIYSSSMFDHITPFLRQLHWLEAKERIYFKLVFTLLLWARFSSTPTCTSWWSGTSSSSWFPSSMQTSLGIVIYTGRPSNSPYDTGKETHNNLWPALGTNQ